MKILITGDEGFVGREYHRQLGHHDITGIDLKSGKDCRDFFKHNDQRFDLVIHLAAIVGGRMTIDGNPLAVATDLSIDAEMFNWALRTKPGAVMYYSSSAAYPTRFQNDNSELLLKESYINFDLPIEHPDMTYGWAKLTGEYLAGFLKAEGIRTHIFRPFSGYGEDQDLDYPFPSFIQRAANRDNPFLIWGDGTQTRDFIHISDVVSASIAAFDIGMDDPVNLCTGRATDFNKLAEIVTRILGYSPEFVHKVDAPRGVDYRVGDPAKMTEFYIPKVTLEEGIDRAFVARGFRRRGVK